MEFRIKEEIGKDDKPYHSWWNNIYAEIIQKRISAFKPRFESGAPPTEVAKVILRAIIESENSLELRHLVGKDAFKLMEIRKNTSDAAFEELVMKTVLN